MLRVSALVLVLAACHHDAKPTAAAPKPAGGELHALCTQMFQRNRTCTDTFIPALVDLRAKHDLPAGIAAKVQADRNAVIAEAKTEWASDSTDAAIGATCEKIEATATDEMKAAADTVKGCLAKEACGDYVTCSQPILEMHLKGAH